MSPHPSVRNVDDWLVIATKDLAPVGKVRICAEIEAHFADGVESHLAEGHSLAQAHQDVLAELGDPFAAGKRFRKRHLTVKEAVFIQLLISRLYPTRMAAFLIINALLVLSFFSSCFWFHQPSIVKIILPSAAALIVISAIAITSFITRHRKTAKGIRLSVALELIDKTFPWIYCPWFIFKFPGPPWAKLLFGIAGILACREFWRTFRLWFKIRSSGDVLSEVEPGAGTAASRAGLV